MADTVKYSQPSSGTEVSGEDVTSINGGAVDAQWVQRTILSRRTADGTVVDVSSTSPVPVEGGHVWNGTAWVKAREATHDGAGTPTELTGAGVQAVQSVLYRTTDMLTPRKAAGSESDGNAGYYFPLAGQTLYNGSTFDRQRGNTEGTLLASAARTTFTSSAAQTNHNARGVVVTLNITAASGTGGLTLVLRSSDPVSGEVYNATDYLPGAAITATGVYAFMFYPGATASAPGSTAGLLVGRQAVALPRTWLISVNPGDASSYTYSVGYQLIV